MIARSQQMVKTILSLFLFAQIEVSKQQEVVVVVEEVEEEEEEVKEGPYDTYCDGKDRCKNVAFVIA